MGKPRVHEVAVQLGISSREVLRRLSVLGEYPRSASSTIEPFLVDKIAQVPNHPTAESRTALREPTVMPVGKLARELNVDPQELAKFIGTYGEATWITHSQVEMARTRPMGEWKTAHPDSQSPQDHVVQLRKLGMRPPKVPRKVHKPVPIPSWQEAWRAHYIDIQMANEWVQAGLEQWQPAKAKFLSDHDVTPDLYYRFITEMNGLPADTVITEDGRTLRWLVSVLDEADKIPDADIDAPLYRRGWASL